MHSANIVVMGKTGAGKSTLINVVLGENLAPTGMGQAITRENRIYEKKVLLPTGELDSGKYSLMVYRLSMYDTVGLETGGSTTDSTLIEMRDYITKARKSSDSETINIVWFCISELNRRFESYEIDLIKKLSIDYEIPFVIVITQSIKKRKGELESQIERVLPDVPLVKVLAEEYPIDEGITIPPRGVDILLNRTINDYRNCKIKLLEAKINLLDSTRNERIQEIKNKGNKCIEKYSSIAAKVGILPVGCIPFIHGICIKMMTELNNIAGIKGNKESVSDIFANVIVGMMMTSLMVVPVLSSMVASAYIEVAGGFYLEALLVVIDNSTDRELNDNVLMTKRIKEELNNLNKSREE